MATPQDGRVRRSPAQVHLTVSAEESEGLLERLWGHPLAKGLDLDSPEAASVRRRIVKSKPFLRSIYSEWYELIADRVPPGPEPILELGSLGGFMEEVLPDLITSDVVGASGVDVAADARCLPFGDGSLRAIVMTNVFHHIPDVASFLDEAQRCLRSGGRIVMVEPWNTSLSRFLHRHFHHETLDPDTKEWAFPSSGPLSDANAALAWIVTQRDRERMRDSWPELEPVEQKPFMPFRYALSGGVSFRSFQPGWSFRWWKALEDASDKRLERLGLLALVVIEHT